MTTSRHYTFITPRIDRTGPCNVAVDIGAAAAAAGWQVRFLYLSGVPQRDDLSAWAEVRRFHWSDLWRLQGVIHTHCLRPDLMGALFSFNPRCQTLSTFHNYFLIDLAFDYPHWKMRLAWLAWKTAVRRLDHRVCISEAMRRYYHRLLPGSRLDLAYNFRRPAPPAPIPEPVADWLSAQRQAGRKVLAYVGTLSPRKNVVALLRALADAPDLALLLCGQGPELAQLQQLGASPALRTRVMLAGQVAAPSSVLAACDALVLPSFAEGLPLVAIEAIQAGRPCLLSNIAVHRELARLGFGCTFDHHRFADFARQARTLIDAHDAPAQDRLRALWRERFSAAAGFGQYSRILASGRHRVP
jgi:glycosyltransferase involved in cell wall biosynthesis